jgi:hypothetical protein
MACSYVIKGCPYQILSNIRQIYKLKDEMDRQVQKNRTTLVEITREKHGSSVTALDFRSHVETCDWYQYHPTA